ncbi:zinc ribbon domain-containing protein [Limosilactobacillus sp. STM2_1]|uniref:Zinc ribbon domain-containing protein n=1 Tax=Limosilactobacillus rudii TaxID=2759755 RepID=A0A7W3UL22_9LACO|nr:zinc ribbon domain-containing protein [Limosilactobacillus rudii]MBB1079506.1 zinc ribbon domain-containing protein [Limosilactobacillus rudii]MBB1097552.1 zinc ribbon domain-containing protein [Limosilactobacillus rudii]MCD7134661.1 zinc ribbon domain-containing protein [Limosilactobacillus rudii]
MRICPHCNTVNEDDATTCVNCGAVLTKPILALICPKCGKVSPIGTKECPVCHEKLVEQNQQVLNYSIQPPKKKRILGVTLMLLIFGGIFLFISINYSRIAPNRYVKYLGVEFNFQDSQHHTLSKRYFMVKQNNKRYQARFSVAYLGQGKQGRNKMNTSETKKFAAQYRQNPHYTLDVKPTMARLNGPQQVVIRTSRSKILTGYKSRSFEEKIASDTFPCIVKGNSQIKYVHLLSAMARPYE